MGRDPWLVAFAPINIVAAGGFLAVSYLKNRQTTGDIDYLLDPEFAVDDDVKTPFHGAIRSVARQLKFNDEWLNEAMAVFVTGKARQKIFQDADAQGIYLYKGQNIHVLAAPIAWALERKLRRIYSGDRGRKSELDMSDAVAMLKELRDRGNGALDGESIRTMNMNGFDVCPDHRTMQVVADEYRKKYNEDIFK